MKQYVNIDYEKPGGDIDGHFKYVFQDREGRTTHLHHFRPGVIEAIEEKVATFLMDQKRNVEMGDGLYKIKKTDFFDDVFGDISMTEYKQSDGFSRDGYLEDMRENIFEHPNNKTLTEFDLQIGGEIILKAFYCYHRKFKDRLRQAIMPNKDYKLYRDWRKKVFERDGYKCKECGTQKKLHAHHIKPRSEYPNLKFDINNGITLCQKCHSKQHPQINLF